LKFVDVFSLEPGIWLTQNQFDRERAATNLSGSQAEKWSLLRTATFSVKNFPEPSGLFLEDWVDPAEGVARSNICIWLT
jgi:hypothetical protein